MATLMDGRTGRVTGAKPIAVCRRARLSAASPAQTVLRASVRWPTGDLLGAGHGSLRPAYNLSCDR